MTTSSDHRVSAGSTERVRKQGQRASIASSAKRGIIVARSALPSVNSTTSSATIRFSATCAAARPRPKLFNADATSTGRTMGPERRNANLTLSHDELWRSALIGTRRPDSTAKFKGVDIGDVLDLDRYCIESASAKSSWVQALVICVPQHERRPIRSHSANISTRPALVSITIWTVEPSASTMLTLETKALTERSSNSGRPAGQALHACPTTSFPRQPQRRRRRERRAGDRKQRQAAEHQERREERHRASARGRGRRYTEDQHGDRERDHQDR